MTCSIRRAWPLALALSLAASACGDDPVQPPTIPTPPTVTETFSGTLTINDAETHIFNSMAAGSVTVTLQTIAPDPAMVMGLSLGTWNGTACATVLANDRASLGLSIVGTVTSIGQLCTRVYDVGAFVEPTSYEIVVVHP
jgi:hypothetical protein